MNNNYLKFLKLILKKNTLLRVLQIYECLNIVLYGTSIEFGAIDNKDKTFSNFAKGKSIFHYSNKISNQKLKVFCSDLTKKLSIPSKKYNNVLFFNILEHLPKYKFKQIKIKALGFGLFTASYSLLWPYLKFLPLLSQICLLLAYILDSFIQVFVKTDLKEIFPLGYLFIVKNNFK